MDVGNTIEDSLSTNNWTDKMTKFRPCIDLHSGQVKQIVGGTLSNVPADLKTNYVSKLPASHYAGLYQKYELRGGHAVKLGPGNDDAAKEALKTWPGGLQVAGGITDENAQYWIDQGAEKVAYTFQFWMTFPTCVVHRLTVSNRLSSPHFSSRKANSPSNG